MKKIFLFAMLLTITNLNINKPTNYIYNSNITSYILEFPNYNISTNNLNNFFSNDKIEWVISYDTNKKYKYINLNKLKNDIYSDIYKINKDKAINLKISGFMINKIKVYDSIANINNLKIENMIIND